jgi:hypothetical protein
MQPFKCPNCGAPPPAPLQYNQPSYHCVYCKVTSMVGPQPGSMPPPQPHPTGQQPAVIVIQRDYSGDYDAHHHAAVAHAHAASRMSWVIWAVVVAVVSLGGAGAGIAKCTHHSSILSAMVWDGSAPLHCGGVDNIAVSGVEATFTAGAAIVATGNCQVRCTDCKLSAPTIVEASGNAQVSLINGSAKGTVLLAEATGNARVTVGGNVTVSGRTKEMANGKVSAPTPPPEPTPPPTPTAPLVAVSAPPTATVAPKAATPIVKAKTAAPKATTSATPKTSAK